MCVFFHPKNTQKKKDGKTHGGMWGCDESVVTWCKNVGRGFLSQIQSAFWYFPLKNLRLETSSSHPGFLNFLLSRFVRFFWSASVFFLEGGYVTMVLWWICHIYYIHYDWLQRFDVSSTLLYSMWTKLFFPCPYNHWTLQKRGVWMCIAGFWDLQTTRFEIPRFLGCFLLGFHGIFRCLGMVPISQTLISLHLKVSNTWGRRRLVRKSSCTIFAKWWTSNDLQKC